jgi:hypothetical protein
MNASSQQLVCDVLIFTKLGVPDNSARLYCLRKVISLLPTGNRVVLKRLIGFLKVVAENEKTTKMGAKNLAIVFAPTIFRAKDDAIDKLLLDASSANNLVELFIQNYSEIFLKVAINYIVTLSDRGIRSPQVPRIDKR